MGLFVTTFETGKPKEHPELFNNFKASSITDRLWRPKEIVARIAGATTRQITDLAELGIITPAHDTTGGGTARLYDGRGLYTLMVALALRGTMRPISLKMIIEKILEFEKTKTVKPDFVVILPFGSNLDEPDDGAQLKFFFQKNDEAVFDVLDLAVGGPDPKCYLGTIIKLHDIKIFLKRAFS